MRADAVKMADLTADRPGGLKPFMMPTKLNNQVRVGEGANDLLFQPSGKTPWGATRWTVVVQRPGMLEPTIVSKKEQESMGKMAAAINAGSAIPTAVGPVATKPQAVAAGKGRGRKAVDAAAGGLATDAKASATINATVAAVNGGAKQVVPTGIAGWLFR